jgi:pilus assembly protein CpaB
MRNLGVLLLIIALIIAGVVSYNIYLYLDSNSGTSTETVVEYKTHYVAKNNIEENSFITEEMIEEIQVVDTFDTSIYINNKNEIIGQYANADIKKGEGFIKERLIDSESSKLITSISKGKRAVSISVTQYTAVADLIRPSDYVDIFVFLPEKTVNNIIIRENISKLMLQRVKVLAVQQEMSRDYETVEEDTQRQYSVTVELEPQDIEKVVLGESIGQLKLALRSIDDTGIVKTNGEVWRELLTDKDFYKEWLYFTENASGASSGDYFAPPEDYIDYTVRYGDTLRGIAGKIYGDEDLYTFIKEANGIGNSNLIIAGSVLKIPKLSE